MLVKILFINIAVFVFIRLAAVVSVIFGLPAHSIVEWVSMPTNLTTLAHRPWTALTYMVAHYDFLHILFNMLWLYWLGRIFLDLFTEKHFAALYIYGGLGGALLYLLIYNVVPAYQNVVESAYLIGASASVYAIVVAAAMKAPNYQINLMLIGGVSLKWVVIFIIGFDLLTVTDGANLGGHIAHIGGILVGMLFSWAFNKGTDITKPLNTLIDKLVTLFSKKPEMTFKRNIKKKKQAAPKSGVKNNTSKASKTELSEMDSILEKIKHSGYTALTDEEKEKLFNISKKA